MFTIDSSLLDGTYSRNFAHLILCNNGFLLIDNIFALFYEFPMFNYKIKRELLLTKRVYSFMNLYSINVVNRFVDQQEHSLIMKLKINTLS